jgi:hypothetical protein
MIALISFVLAILIAPFKSQRRLEAENAALGQQSIILRRKSKGRAKLTNADRWFFVQLVPVDPGHRHDHPSRDFAALASGGLSSLLALEITAARRTAAQTEPELHHQNAAHRIIDDRHRNSTAADQAGKMVEVCTARHIHVDSGHGSFASRVLPIRGDAIGYELVHSFPVAHHEAMEAPLKSNGI